MDWSTPRGVCLASLRLFWALALVGTSCTHTAPPPPDLGTGKSQAAADAVPSQGPAAEELPGVDLASLEPAQRERLFAQLDTLASPCGRAHSLRTSLSSDGECKRSAFALRYVTRLLETQSDDEQVRKAYEARYSPTRHTFELSQAPHAGSPTAPIKLVKFFDYACPHCKAMDPVLDKLAAAHPGSVAIYYKHFPHPLNKDSLPASIAALAADRQGKFQEMHKLLFSRKGHSADELRGYAAELGLDLARFEADFNDPKLRERVLADRQEGDAAGFFRRPAILLNGRLFTDSPKLLKDWVEEELAVSAPQ